MADVTMPWSHEKAMQRAVERYAQAADLKITDVVREIDFNQIARTKPKRVIGAHLYADITNFNRQLREQPDSGENLVRLLHIYSREISRVVSNDFDAQKVHFQGPRLHALRYRPVSNPSKICAKAALTALAIRHTTNIFNDVFELDASNEWKSAASVGHGRCIATRNGTGGDQELLFLGSAANHAAKIIADRGLRSTKRFRELLSPKGRGKLMLVRRVDVISTVWRSIPKA